MSTIANLAKDVKRIWRHSFQAELDSALEQHLRAHALLGVRAALEAALVEELLAARAAALTLHEGALADYYRSGTFQRRVITRYGAIPNLHVPKLRQHNAIRTWQILARYQQAMPQVLDTLCYLYTLGLSLRDLQEGLYVAFGGVLSRSAINRVTLAAQAPMDAWRQQPITDTPPILIVDGVWVRLYHRTGATWVDRSGHVRQRVRALEQVILAVLGVWADGRHALIHYTIATTEDTAAWQQVLQELADRGLSAAAVQLVVSDGTKGLPEAMKTHLPRARRQRCTVHKVRGMERYLQYRDLPTQDAQTGQSLTPEIARQQRRTAISAAALEIFQARTRVEAEQRLADFVAQWARVEPQAVKTFQRGLKHCFTFYVYDQALHPLVRSTNLLERFFREFRTKADEIGAFPNATSCLTLFYLVMVREHAKHERVDIAKTG
jgi:transposase-like protein